MKILDRITGYFQSFGTWVDHSLGEGVYALAAWIVLFVLGTWFPGASVLRHFFEGAKLPSGFDAELPVVVHSLLLPIAFFSWTWSNLALLCLAAAYLGIAARPDINTTDRKAWLDVLPRAFVVFLICVLQEIILTGQPIPTSKETVAVDMQQHYFRLAIICSIFCFAAAYRPAFFDSLVDKIFGQLESGKKTD